MYPAFVGTVVLVVTILSDDLPRAADGQPDQEHGADASAADAHPDRGLGLLRRLLVGVILGLPVDRVLRAQVRRADQSRGALPDRRDQAAAAGARADPAQDHPVALREHLRADVLLGHHHSRRDPQLPRRPPATLVIQEGLKRSASRSRRARTSPRRSRTSGLFPPLVVRMLRVGESTGALDTALAQRELFLQPRGARGDRARSRS